MFLDKAAWGKSVLGAACSVGTRQDAWLRSGAAPSTQRGSEAPHVLDRRSARKSSMGCRNGMPMLPATSRASKERAMATDLARHIQEMPLVDTHEHLRKEKEWLEEGPDILQDLFGNYVPADLIVAAPPPE